ncbi:MAG: hypothetical protein PVH64_03675 [Bacillota bacterium]|jgi:hypothetical protein
MDKANFAPLIGNYGEKIGETAFIPRKFLNSPVVGGINVDSTLIP